MQLTKRTPQLVLLLTLALSSVSVIQAKPSPGFWDDLWKNAGDAGKTIVDGLTNATKDGIDAGKTIVDGLSNATKNGIDTGKNIADGLADAAKDGANAAKDAVDGLIDTKHQFLDDVKQISDNLTQAIASSVKNSFSNLTSTLSSSIQKLESLAASEGNFIKRIALNNGLNALKGLASQAAQLGLQLADLKAKIAGSAVEDVNDALKDLKQWGEDQLARVANLTEGAALDVAKGLINDLIDGFSNSVEDLKQLEKVKLEFLEGLIDNIESYQLAADDLINSLNLCKGRTAIVCKLNIDHCVDKLPSAASLKALIQKGEELAKTAVVINARVAQLLLQLEKDKLALAAKIAQITADLLLGGRTAASSSTAPDSDSDGSSSSAPDSSDDSASSSSAPDSSSPGPDSSSPSSDDSASSSDAPESSSPGPDDSGASSSTSESTTQRSGCATEPETTSAAPEESTTEVEESTSEESTTEEESTTDEDNSSPAAEEESSSAANQASSSSANQAQGSSSTEASRSGC